jgi:cytidine deaminase
MADEIDSAYISRSCQTDLLRLVVDSLPNEVAQSIESELRVLQHAPPKVVLLAVKAADPEIYKSAATSIRNCIVLQPPDVPRLLHNLISHPAHILPSDESNQRKSIVRLFDALLHRTRVTPTRDEYAMFAAYGGALRSAALRGGVGAALSDTVGDVIAVGTAEVPSFGGGQYWEDDVRDARDFHLGYDPATRARLDTVKSMLEILQDRFDFEGVGLSDLAEDVLSTFDSRANSNGVGHGTAAAQTFESLGRVVHAEMAALLVAARNGVRPVGMTMYITAQPCRQCIRHLVAAGISRVVYFGDRLQSPPSFHADAVETIESPAGSPGRMLLVPFDGFSPALLMRLFVL